MQSKQFWPSPHPFLFVEALVSSKVISEVKLYNLEIRLCDQNTMKMKSNSPHFPPEQFWLLLFLL